MEELDIVAAGYAGEAGAACIAREKFNEMLRRFRKDYAEHLCEESEMPGSGMPEGGLPEDAMREKEPCVRIPAGEGGILAALYLLAKERKCGLRIALRSIPVRQDTIELCELYGLNPYRLKFLCEAGDMKRAGEENVMDCVVCGSCSYICPAHRNLTSAFKAMKDKITAEAKKGKG